MFLKIIQKNERPGVATIIFRQTEGIKTVHVKTENGLMKPNEKLRNTSTKNKSIVLGQSSGERLIFLSKW